MTSDREDDWGEPLPGSWVPEPERTQPQLQRLPLGLIQPGALFSQAGPVQLDLGCGNGRASILHAMAHPDWNHLAIDNFAGAIRHAARRAGRRGLSNLRFAIADARELVTRLQPASCREVCLYHPQPIYDLAQANKRLLTPGFLVQVHRLLEPDGQLIIQTDHPAYWSYLKQVLPCFFTLDEQTGPWPDSAAGRTRREILARQWNLPIFRGLAQPRHDITLVEAAAHAEKLPLPRFDADRRWQEVEGME
jgi:tRNA (guanine-N7-)-methyltransferase